MAHFAKLDDSNNVLSVISVSNADIMTNQIENEQTGITFLTNLTGYSNWKQTSYNTRNNKHYEEDNLTLSADQSKAFRGNFATIGGTYDPVNDIFMPPRPYVGWVKNITTASWDPPVAKPDDPDEGVYYWDEETQTWRLKT